MEGKRKEPVPFQLISQDEEKKLPASVVRWIASTKEKRGTHFFAHDDRQYLLITAGVRPNPGYRLTLSQVRSGKQGWEIVVKESEPQPGRFYPQVLVVPYLLGEVRKTVKVIEESTGKPFGEDSDPDSSLR
jgi:hypothetical protein